MIEHFELAQASKSQLPEAKFCNHGQKIEDTLCEFDQSKFIRLISESFLDLKGSQLKALKDVWCAALKSEEFFLIINATNQWVRTVIFHKDLQPETWTGTDRIIHSNILPYNPYWSQLEDGANTRVHFPSCILEEAINEEETLKMKLQEWVDSGGKRAIGTHERKQQGVPMWFWEHWNKLIALVFKDRKKKWFWEIQVADVLDEDPLMPDDVISRVTWRGGRFIRKKTYSDQREFEVVKRVNSHPNIVYGFGDLYEGLENSAYFMERMSTELFSLIVDRIRVDVGDNKPPFSPHDSIDILLQFANAVKHIHQQGVVHCDLKSVNILISEIATSDNASHYLVKVADFGSARYFGFWQRSIFRIFAGFTAGESTDAYAAPEALQQRTNKSFRISYPDRIDVFSFGIVAFEVLTGENNHKLLGKTRKSKEESRKSVIDGTLRPPLRAACGKDKEFIQDEELLSLIERCWDSDPSKRPSFVEICEDLDKAKVRISEKILQSDPPPSQANFVNWPSSAPEAPSGGICDVDIQILDSRRPHKRVRISASCGVDHLFGFWRFIAAVFLLAFMFFSSLTKEMRIAALVTFMALILFVFIPMLRYRIHKFREESFGGKVKKE